MPLDRSKKLFSRVVRVTLYKSVVPEDETKKRNDFFIWGSSDFLYVDSFSALSRLALIEDSDFSTEKLTTELLTEDRHLYIYKDQETNLFPKKALNWIFNSQLAYPLLVITLLKAGNLDLIHSVVTKHADIGEFRFDTFKTIGNGAGVLVFRSKTYEPVLKCLVELSVLSQNTYSIAGVQNPLSDLSPKEGFPTRLFTKLKMPPNPAKEHLASVTVDLRLRDYDGSKRLVQDVFEAVKDSYVRIQGDFKIPKEDLLLSSDFVIGRFDIEVKIEGYTVYILEFLLNPRYGLANVASSFHKNYIFESRTTWKTTWSLKSNIEK